MGAPSLIAQVDPSAARRAIAGVAVRTPTIACEQLTERAGGAVALKAECLQVTGSFKLRGALNKVASLGELAAAGLVAASAGNHARAVAQAARVRGVSCEVFMPRDAPVSKVTAVQRLGALVNLDGDSVEDALAKARERSEAAGWALVHPFDDLDVIAGQGTVGLELLEDVENLARVVVPVGGGGLASGIGIALAHAHADVQLVGVQAAACATYAHELALAGATATESPRTEVADGVAPRVTPGLTIADGIALKRPGTLTLPLLRELLDTLETVSEEEIADAMMFLLEGAKLVSEGAGAVAVAALLSGRLDPVHGTTVAIVSGGNVDGDLLAGLLRRHETAEGRHVRMFTRVPDRPGGLAELLGVLAAARVNLLGLEHVRDAVPLHVQESGVELTLQTRGPEHTEQVLAALADAGYEVRLG